MSQSLSVHTEELAKVKAHRWQLSCLGFREDGFKLATGGWDKEVHVWDMVNLQVEATLKAVHRLPITSLSWQGGSGRGEVLCTGSADHTAVLWNAITGEHLQTLSLHSGWVLGTCFSSSGSVLATASWDKTIGIWDPSTGQQINSYDDHGGGVWSVTFSPDSSSVLCSTGEDGSVKLWDLREGKVMQNLTSGHNEAVYCAKWSPDGTMIASGSSDTKICIWDTATFSLVNTIYGHTATVKSLDFDPNTKAAVPILASAGDYTLLLSDPRPTQKAELLSLSPHAPGKEVEAVSISPDGSLLVSGGRDGALAIMTLTVPLVQQDTHDDSVSSKLRRSQSYLEHSFDNDSAEELGDATSLTSTSEGDVRRENANVLPQQEKAESPRNVRNSAGKQKSKPRVAEKQQKSTGKVHSARISRQKRAEKKVVDLPSMIAHLSASVVQQSSTLEEHQSSSDNSDAEPEANAEQIKSLIGVTQKVSKFSQITKKTSVQEMHHKAPAPRLSLLGSEDIPETIKESRKFFEMKESGLKTEDNTDYSLETEHYHGYSSLLPGEYSDSDISSTSSAHYTLRDDLDSANEDEEVPFSMI